MRSVATLARAIRERGPIGVRHACPAFGVGEDRSSVFRIRSVSVRMVKMPMRVNQPARRLMKRRSDVTAYLRDTRAIARVNDRSSPATSDCRYRSAGAQKRKNLWTNLGHGQRSGLVCGPGEVDRPSRRETMAANHAKRGMWFNHVSILSPHICRLRLSARSKGA